MKTETVQAKQRNRSSTLKGTPTAATRAAPNSERVQKTPEEIDQEKTCHLVMQILSDCPPPPTETCDSLREQHATISLRIARLRNQRSLLCMSAASLAKKRKELTLLEQELELLLRDLPTLRRETAKTLKKLLAKSQQESAAPSPFDPQSELPILREATP